MSILVGKKAPVFHAPAVVEGGKIVEDFSLEQYIGKSYVIFFFYPADFTFVCPTEIIAFQNKSAAFAERATVLVGCSVDSQYSHWKWLNTEKHDGGIKGVTFPLVVDQALSISRDYGVLAGEHDFDENGKIVFKGTPMAYRGLFLIDKQGVVQHEVVNNFPLGRSVDETLRMVDALQFFEKHGEVCPANWHAGEKALKPTQDGVANYLGEAK